MRAPGGTTGTGGEGAGGGRSSYLGCAAVLSRRVFLVNTHVTCDLLVLAKSSGHSAVNSC